MPTIHALLEQARENLLAGKADAAEQIYRRVLASDRNNAVANNDYANLLRDRGQLEEAVACYRRALKSLPNSAMLLANMAGLLLERGELDRADDACRRAISAEPNYAPAYDTLGSIYTARLQFAEAECSYRQALAIQPGFPAALYNLAVCLRELGKLDEAFQANAHALQLQPRFADARALQGCLRLVTGDFERGWPDFEWRERTGGRSAMARSLPQPIWDGRPADDKTILLHAEEGFGDTLQFVRLARRVKERCGRVILECQPELVELLSGCCGIDEVIAGGSDLPPFDVHISLLSLPAVFGTRLADIPAEVPYLRAPAALVESWRAEFDRAAFKIGIAWQGNSKQQRNRIRSFSPVCFESIASLPQVRLYCLQKAPRDEPPSASNGGFPVIDLADRLTSFADTAAALAHLDLVITCDSALAHLAGALGMPVWVGLAKVADWRWLLDRDDSPWYPTMHLFRQPDFGNWHAVFARIREELRILVESRG